MNETDHTSESVETIFWAVIQDGKNSDLGMSKENNKFEIYVFFCSSENLAETLPQFGNTADFFTQSLVN
jgi:hypothetical protein